MMYDVLVRDREGKLKTRTISDMAEGVIKAKNSNYVACAAIRSLENAARASEILNIDKSSRNKWLSAAAEVKQNLPVDKTGMVYKYADDADIPLSSEHLGMIYPFSFDVNGKRAGETLRRILTASHLKIGDTSSDLVLSYNWLWAVSRLITLCFYRGLGDEGYEILKQTPSTVGPFMAPNEHYRKDKGPFLPWFATGSGSFVYACNSMFVQVYDEKGAILLPAIPSKLKNAEFKNLMTTEGVTVSGEIQNGKLVKLTAASDIPLDWTFRIPKRIADAISFTSGIAASKRPDEHGLVTVKCKLNKGVTKILNIP